MAMNKSQYVNVILRLVLLGFTTITLGLIGAIHSYHYFKFPRVNLGISACVITYVFGVLCGLVVPFMDAGALNDGLGMVIFDFMDFGLLLASAATLSNQNGLCHKVVDDPVKGSGPGPLGYCGVYRGAIAFFWLTWVVSFVCLAYSVLVWYSCTFGDKSWKTYTPTYIKRHPQGEPTDYRDAEADEGIAAAPIGSPVKDGEKGHSGITAETGSISDPEI